MAVHKLAMESLIKDFMGVSLGGADGWKLLGARKRKKCISLKGEVPSALTPMGRTLQWAGVKGAAW
jgi:hypothetical protein